MLTAGILEYLEGFNLAQELSEVMFLGANMINIDISPLLVVSQEVMPDVYVLSAAMFNRIIRQADCTLIVT